jgi:hypothetical protein
LFVLIFLSCRLSLFSLDHDDRVGGQISYGNRTWRKGDSNRGGGHGGQSSSKHVSFKSGGGVRGRLGPKGQHAKGGVNLNNLDFDDQDMGGLGGTNSGAGGSRGGYQAGRARPAG